MATNAREKDVLEAEQKFWDAMQTKDGSVAAKMTDDGCIIVGAQGVSAIDPKMMGKMTTEGKWELEHFAFDEKTRQVRFISDDVAIIAYPVSERLVVDGKQMELRANDSSVWIHRDGEWRCALHTESLAGDPYGRDKTSTGHA
jgi:hypothetical protein